MSRSSVQATAEAIADALRGQMPAPAVEPDTVLTVDEAAQSLDISRSLVYKLIGRGELDSIRIGNRRFIPVSDVNRIINGSMPPPQQNAG